MTKVQELTGDKFDKFIGEGTTIVDFFADWCMPCVMMAPVMDELSDKFDKKIKFAKVNVDKNRELAQKFNIASIPNFVLFKDGKQVEQFTGAMSSEEFEKKLQSFTE